MSDSEGLWDAVRQHMRTGEMYLMLWGSQEGEGRKLCRVYFPSNNSHIGYYSGRTWEVPLAEFRASVSSAVSQTRTSLFSVDLKSSCVLPHTNYTQTTYWGNTRKVPLNTPCYNSQRAFVYIRSPTIGTKYSWLYRVPSDVYSFNIKYTTLLIFVLLLHLW